VARIPLPTDAERTALEDSAWDHLEAQWDDWAKRRTENAADYEERAKLERGAEAMGEAMALKAKNLRGNPKAFEALKTLYITLVANAIRGLPDDQIERAAQEVDSLPDKRKIIKKPWC